MRRNENGVTVAVVREREREREQESKEKLFAFWWAKIYKKYIWKDGLWEKPR